MASIEESEGLVKSRFHDDHYGVNISSDAVHTVEILLPIIDPVQSKFDGFRKCYMHTG